MVETETVTAEAPRMLGLERTRVRELTVYVAVGGTCFVLYTLAYLASRPFLPPIVANTGAFLVSSWINTILHRRYTFEVEKGEHGGRQQLENLATLILGLVVTNGTLLLLDWGTDPSRLLEYGALVGANVASGILHYVLLRWWVFAPRRNEPSDR